MDNKEKKILIVDDIEINRELLKEIFKSDYKIMEACDGAEAVKIINSGTDISAVLLDLIMPEMNGLEVLKKMNENGIITNTPVFLITAENDERMLSRGYELGAVDVVTKPFMPDFLKCRINNIIELYEHRNQLQGIVARQVEHIKNMNRSMIETLAAIIEFRDCESGEHVKRICSLTDIIMAKVSEMYPEYYLPQSEIDKIVSSSILHDVGKISIPDRILNKPGRLTKEEFEVMKEHTTRGCEILRNIAHSMDEDVYKYSYDICRHHHERWDGRGYPDGLKGDDISIWAQVVSVADVYDALTAKRVYKEAFSHKTAVEMINNGECGSFNPKVLKAFEACLDKIERKAESES